MNLKIYGSSACPFSHRVLWAAQEKGLPFEYIDMPVEDTKPEWFKKEVNPRGTIPVLKVGDQVVLESSIILEYLEEAYPNIGVSFYPRDPIIRSQVRFFVDTFSQFAPTCICLLKNTDPTKKECLQKAVVDKLRPVVALLMLYYNRGPYFLGEQFSMAEISSIPFLERLSLTMSTWHNFDIFAADPTGRLKIWFKASTSREAYQKTTKSPEFYLEMCAKMCKMKTACDY
eukprot:TRINITY_DN3010_c0_g1_i1.p1 TRINITY_DN3010_c0_g1~~TRINITY_DN3010_c0_g1_i1.p1  ORF type:complete len:229 (-),score=20.16 TRINITY_DN3010_c0_g1_i1:336-1022(-)